MISSISSLWSMRTIYWKNGTIPLIRSLIWLILQQIWSIERGKFMANDFMCIKDYEITLFLLRIILYLPYSSYLQYFILILKEESEASGKHEISLFFCDLVNLFLSPTTWCPPPQHLIFFYYLGFLVVNNFFNLNSQFSG